MHLNIYKRAIDLAIAADEMSPERRYRDYDALLSCLVRLTGASGGAVVILSPAPQIVASSGEGVSSATLLEVNEPTIFNDIVALPICDEGGIISHVALRYGRSVRSGKNRPPLEGRTVLSPERKTPHMWRDTGPLRPHMGCSKRV